MVIIAVTCMNQKTRPFFDLADYYFIWAGEIFILGEKKISYGRI